MRNLLIAILFMVGLIGCSTGPAVAPTVGQGNGITAMATDDEILGSRLDRLYAIDNEILALEYEQLRLRCKIYDAKQAAKRQAVAAKKD